MIVYLVSNTPHLPYLVVSLYTLRQQYNGIIKVFAWKESIDLVRKIAEDKTLDIQVQHREPELRKEHGVRSNAQFFAKIRMMQSISGDDVNVYLDCDTVVCGSLQPLFDMGSIKGFTGTQFCHWLCNGSRISKRIRDLEKYENEEINALIHEVSTQPLPSLNGGSFACHPSSPILEQWYSFCMIAKDAFIADEKCLHLFNAQRFRNHFSVLMGGAYNCSPKLKSPDLKDKDVIIWHFHGDSNCRPTNKSQKGFFLWWPLYKHCLRENVGNMQSWISGIKNKHLNRIDNWDKC